MFESLKNADFDVVKHMVVVGTLDRETFYRVISHKLATGQLRNAPRF